MITFRQLTKQKNYTYFQQYRLSNSTLTAGTLIQATRIHFPGRREIKNFGLFAKLIGRKEDNAPSATGISTKANNEIKFERETFQTKIDRNITPSNLNKNITDVLKELAKEEEAAGEFYRQRAYHAAIESIGAHPKKIKSGKEARELKFVGQGIEMKIDEILESGTCSYTSGRPNSAKRQLFNVLTKIPRIGTDALKYIGKGYKDLEELINDSDLKPYQKYIIEHIKELDVTIPKWEMYSLRRYIFQTLKQLDHRYLVEACGSFRRGTTSFSKSLNIIISHPDFKDATGNIDTCLTEFINDLKIKEFCIEYFPEEYLAICRIPPQINTRAKPRLRRKIELRAVPYKNFWLTVLAKTGDDVFYRSLQKTALAKGFRLSDTMLARIDSNGSIVGKPLMVDSENDIFEILDTKYLAPGVRNWRSLTNEQLVNSTAILIE